MQLRRNTPVTFYFSEKKEYDFVVFQNGKHHSLYKVSWQLDQHNMDRELAGLIEAMDYSGQKYAEIITFIQWGTFSIKVKTINAQPF
ncbi:MAG: hypothetical protein WCR72_10135 [Bacteroidota bacterium]